jgi:hypothetical protein
MGLPAKLSDALQGADFIWIDGVVFTTEYARVPDEDTVADDVVLEVKLGETEYDFTFEELDTAEHVGEGVYRLKTGSLMRCLSTATIH